MNRRLHWWLSICAAAQAAQGAEVRLDLAPPQSEWLLPAESVPEPCGTGITRIEGCSLQLLPEGMILVGERSLAFDLGRLLSAGNYEAVLARIRVNRIELDLIEAGDVDGFLLTRRPTDGGARVAPLPPPGARRTRVEMPTLGVFDDGAVALNNPQRGPAPSALATRSPTGREADAISVSMLYVIGHSYFALQQYVPAQTAFELVLAAVPNHIRAHESLGMLYLRTERYADARVHLSRAVELGGNSAHVYAAVGYLELRTGHPVAAAHAFQRTLALEPDNRSAQRGLLLALTETRDHAKARALVERLLRAELHDRDLWLYRAQIELFADDDAAALSSLETALRLGDESPENRRALVTLHIKSGNMARAVELLQGSSASWLSHAFVDQALGWLADANEWDSFRELSASVDREALNRVEQSRLLTRRAALSVHDGNRRAARAALEEALTLDPSNAGALVALGKVYAGERDYGRAELVLVRASGYAAVRAAALIARADVAIAQEDFDGALDLLRDVVAENPAHSEVRRSIDVLEDLVLFQTQR